MDDAGQEAGFHAIMDTDQDIFQYGHTGEKADVLECTGNAQVDDLVRLLPFNGLAVEDDVAFGDLVDACDQVENGGLAGAVWSDDAIDFSFIDMEGHIGNGCQAAELFNDIFHFEQH